MKVLWLTNIPSPYRVNFFNELGKYCELTVLFETKKSKDRDKSWTNFNTENFKSIFLPGKKMAASNAICPAVIKYLKKGYDHIVVANFSDPTGIIAIFYMKLFGISYEIESDGGFLGNNKSVKGIIKTIVLKNATRYFSTANEHDRYYLAYGVDKKRIVRYPFTSILEKDIIPSLLTEARKRELRKKLNISESKIVLGVGQFIYRKGFDILIETYNMLPDDIGIYIVGGEPTQEYKDLACNKDRIHFVGYKEKNELSDYYMASDVFVLPTREDIWGLVINEAMAYGLPVVTTNRCVAGLELVKNNENGFTIPVNNKEELARAIIMCFDNYEAFAQQSLDTINEYTIEKMAMRHIEIWNK